jgi:hypothetical protein
MSLSFTQALPVFPQRRFMRQTAGIVGNIPAATLPAGVTGWFAVNGNSAYEPFSTTAKPDSATGYITEVQGSDSETAAGFGIMSQVYKYARVHNSRLRVSCVPSSSTDQTILACFAITAQHFSSASPPYSYPVARAQYGYREAVCYPGNILKMNTVESTTHCAAVLGQTKSEWMCQPPVVINSAPVESNNWYWIVQYFAADGLVSANPICFRIELAQEVELYECELLGV